MFINIEIKAKIKDSCVVRNILKDRSADYRGTDLQEDTYFTVSSGRLKLREGNIEKNLIHYLRTDIPGIKESNFQIARIDDSQGIKQILTRAIGIKVIVKKSREIFFIDNVKFHIDDVEHLGSFIEIEASNLQHDISKEKLMEQCIYYRDLFGIKDEDMVHNSYSDMLLEKFK